MTKYLYGWKFLNSYGATTHAGIETIYPLPLPGQKWGNWLKHPTPVVDGKSCGTGRYHLMKHLSAEYAPSSWWVWYARGEGLAGESDEKFGVHHIQLRRISRKVFHRIIRLGWCKGANLENADLQGANLRSANLENADLQNANLESADLQNANLRGAYLQGANLQNADLRSANLENADLRSANLRGADLENAYLQGANLENAYLQGAYLQGADLQNANLENADLRSAYLRGAYLQGANLENTVGLE